MNNNKTQTQIVILGGIMNDLDILGAKALNGEIVIKMESELVPQTLVGEYVLDYAWNDIRVAVRNTPENAEGILAVWKKKHEKTKAFVVKRKAYYTEEMRQRELKWHARAILDLENQIEEKAEWLLVGVPDKDYVRVRAVLATLE